MTTGQIGEVLGVSHQRVSQIIRGADDFPEPEIILPNGTRLWLRKVALAWFTDHRRRPYRKIAESNLTNSASTDLDESPL